MLEPTSLGLRRAPSWQRTTAAALLLAAAAGGLSATAHAAVLGQSLPAVATPDGVQADEDATGPLDAPLAASSAGTLESIAWWGYHGANSGGAALDSFLIALSGMSVTGTLSTSTVGSLTRYELDIADMAWTGAAGTLSIQNGTGTEWFWQLGTGSASSGPYMAYQLLGTPAPVTAVPEPAGWALAALALLALRTQRRRA